jgi:hypothetical protein
MKRFLMVAALAALPVSGAAAETVFVGNVFLTFVSSDSQCASTFTVNDYARVLYRPRGAALGNSGDSYLAYVTTRSSFVMVAENNDFRANINYAGSGVSSRASLLSNAGGITVWKQTPKNIGAGTETVSIQGRFANFFAINPCIVEFSGELLLR